jgi:acetylornithine deacetylase/succinyl-diaminopimelate desuccinylase-like protein
VNFGRKAKVLEMLAATPTGIREFIQERRDNYLSDLRDFCSIGSVPTDADAIAEMATLVRARLKRTGFNVAEHQVVDGHPAFIAQIAGNTGKRLLLFNHYDVDPPGDLGAWDSPPFEAQERGGKLFGRGLADNKGNLLARIHAIEALLEHRGSLPCSVTFLIEAKKSMYAPHLQTLVDGHRDELSADACLWENSAADQDGRPTLRLGDKGMLMLRITARGTARDLSSQYSPIFPSAAWKLVHFLSRIRDVSGRIVIPNFHDEIVPLSRDERALLNDLPVDTKALESLAGVRLRFASESDALARYYGDPTANIASLSAAPQAPGMMSVNPSIAVAELDFRLVPNQDARSILRTIERLAGDFDGAIEIESSGSMPPARTPAAHPFVRKVAEVAERVHGTHPVLEPLSPTVGSRSVLNWSGMPIVGYGIAYAGSNIQAANEHIRLEDYWRGIEFYVALVDAFAAEAAPTQ